MVDNNIIIEKKKCTKCHILKDIYNFGIRKNRKSGYRSSCTECDKERKLIDPIYKLSIIVRGRINKFFKLNKINKKNNTFDIVGCSPIFLKEHIENKFTEGMSWDNRGLFGWHIDHIIPLSSAKTKEEIYKLCHYTNLQPLWDEDNLKKSNKYYGG
jgi:hypothetical protein